MTDKPIVVGLTGPTGAGKSVLTALLGEAGVPVVDADRLAREATAPGSPCLAELAAAFSPAILRPDGSLDRQALAAAAFANEEAHALLNAITHPPVLTRSRELLDGYFAAGARAAVLDAPLLFESGADAMCTRTVAVLAPPEVRLARILRRDGLTPEQARARMNAQPPETYYSERADEVLRNDGDLAAFEETARRWIARLRKDAGL